MVVSTKKHDDFGGGFVPVSVAVMKTQGLALVTRNTMCCWLSLANQEGPQLLEEVYFCLVDGSLIAVEHLREHDILLGHDGSNGKNGAATSAKAAGPR